MPRSPAIVPARSAIPKPFPYWYLLWEMSAVEFKLRDQGTLLGFFWTLLQPALMFVVLYALFIKWIGKFVNQYAAYLLIGLVLWNFFQKATSLALNSFRRRISIVRNYSFPREILVCSVVLAVFASSMLEFLVLCPFLALMGLTPHWSWLVFPFVAFLILFFTLGVSLLLSILAAQYQDIERIWEVLSAALFYLTPIFYPLSLIEGWKKALLSLNPLTQLIGMARGCLIDGVAPNPSALALLILLCLGLFFSGLALIRRCQQSIVDMILT